ncbi:hypothetical protein D3C72_1310270 [compost metagenome]
MARGGGATGELEHARPGGVAVWCQPRGDVELLEGLGNGVQGHLLDQELAAQGGGVLGHEIGPRGAIGARGEARGEVVLGGLVAGIEGLAGQAAHEKKSLVPGP